MSSTYEDEGPLPGFRTEMAIYYIVYFVVFPFFFVNIFVALVIVTFNELGEAELTDNIDKNQVKCTNNTKVFVTDNSLFRNPASPMLSKSNHKKFMFLRPKLGLGTISGGLSPHLLLKTLSCFSLSSTLCYLCAR